MRIEVKIPKGLLNDIENVYKTVSEPVLVALATEVQHELMSQKPPPPRQGSMQFVSEAQRRFVMASIRRGDITVPYKRGIDKKSQRMNRSFKIIRSPREIVLTNSANYWQYVIGSQQARIHQNRWKTALQMVEKVIDSGLLVDTLNTVITKKFGRG